MKDFFYMVDEIGKGRALEAEIPTKHTTIPSQSFGVWCKIFKYVTAWTSMCD